MPSPSLRQLRYFCAYARHGHVGRAAAACAVSQPALSMQLSELEASLGTTLIERQDRRAALTPAGREVAERAQRILAEMAELEDVCQRHSGVLAGPVTLGVIPSIAPYLLPRILPAAHRAYPALALQVREAPTETLVAELEAGELDVALVSLPVDADAVVRQPLLRDRLLLAGPRDRLGPSGAPADPELLGREPLLLMAEGHCLRDQALAFCRRLSPGVEPAFSGASLATVMQMVAQGYGVTLVPEMAAATEARAASGLTLQRFAEPQPERSVGLIWRQGAARGSDFAALGEVIAGLAPAEAAV